MDRITGAFATLALGVGLTLAGSAFAQPKEGCPVDPAGETAGVAGSEEYAAARTGAEKGAETPNPDAGATAEAKGSGAPMPGVGECDEIQDLSTRTEG